MVKSLRVLVLAAAGLAMMMLAVPASASAAPASAGSVTQTASAPGTGADIHGCPFLDFCAYPSPNFQGTPKLMEQCRFYTLPFIGEGSWINNQTSGTRAAFYNANHGFLNFTAPAFAADSAKNWDNVFFVKPC
jgi:hypothetical protein